MLANGGVMEALEFLAWFGDSKVVDKGGRPMVVYHGTDASTDFDAFERRPGDVGIHFGTIGQANDRLCYLDEMRRSGNFKDRMRKGDPAPRIIPVFLSIRNALRMEDVGAWNPSRMSTQLGQAFADDKDYHRIDYLKSNREVREFLEARGYDGIVYRNDGETAGGSPLRKAKGVAWDTFKVRQKALRRSGVRGEDLESEEYKQYLEAAGAEAMNRYSSRDDSYIVFRPGQIVSAIGNSGGFQDSASGRKPLATRWP